MDVPHFEYKQYILLPYGIVSTLLVLNYLARYCLKKEFHRIQGIINMHYCINAQYYLGVDVNKIKYGYLCFIACSLALDNVG